MGNRLKELRALRGIKAARAARELGISRSEYYKLERGVRRLTDVWIGKLSTYLDVSPGDLVSDGNISVPVNYLIARHGFGGSGALPANRHIEAPGFVMNAQDCFAFEVRDASASRFYPPGTQGIARRLDRLGRPLRRGDRVVVRHFKTTRADGARLEDVVGILDCAVNGDLIVLLPSEDRTLAGAVVVRRAPFGAKPSVVTEAEIYYEPDDDDAAEILGVIVAAMIPQ